MIEVSYTPSICHKRQLRYYHTYCYINDKLTAANETRRTQTSMTTGIRAQRHEIERLAPPQPPHRSSTTVHSMPIVYTLRVHCLASFALLYVSTLQW